MELQELKDEIELDVKAIVERLKAKRETLDDAQLDSFLGTLEKAAKILTLLDKKTAVKKEKENKKGEVSFVMKKYMTES